MKATAKYLFDEDFSGDKPTITMVEHERRRADAESQAYRNGFAAAQAQAHADAEQRIAMALGRLADGLERVDRGLATIEARSQAKVDVPKLVPGVYTVTLELFYPTYKGGTAQKGEFKAISNELTYRVESAEKIVVVNPPPSSALRAAVGIGMGTRR